MNYKIVDMETYYRRGVFRHFSEDCKCSVSITSRVDVTALKAWSKQTDTRFYINFLYVLSRALNAREDYRLAWDWQNERLLCWDKINPTQYVFHADTETFSVAYTEYDPDYAVFYARALADLQAAQNTRAYGLDAAHHPNWFDASCLPWLSYDSLNVELPDGYLYFSPIVNWGSAQCAVPLQQRIQNGKCQDGDSSLIRSQALDYERCKGCALFGTADCLPRIMMPVTVRMNHAAADGFQIARVFRLLEEEMNSLCCAH